MLYIDDDTVVLKYSMPWQEVASDFYDKVRHAGARPCVPTARLTRARFPPGIPAQVHNPRVRQLRLRARDAAGGGHCQGGRLAEWVPPGRAVVCLPPQVGGEGGAGPGQEAEGGHPAAAVRGGDPGATHARSAPPPPLAAHPAPRACIRPLSRPRCLPRREFPRTAKTS